MKWGFRSHPVIWTVAAIFLGLPTALIVTIYYVFPTMARAQIAFSADKPCEFNGIEYGKAPRVICRMAEKYQTGPGRFGCWYQIHLLSYWIEATNMSYKDIYRLFPDYTSKEEYQPPCPFGICLTISSHCDYFPAHCIALHFRAGHQFAGYESYDGETCGM